MALSPASLAAELVIGVGQSGPPTVEILAFASGVIDALKLGTAGFGGPIPGPYPISGISGTVMAAGIASAAGYPGVSPVLQGFCDALATALNTGLVTYTGPGPTFFTGGKISGYDPAAFAAAIAAGAPYPSVTAELEGMASAFATVLAADADVLGGVIS